jgi:hypothetical protein
MSYDFIIYSPEEFFTVFVRRAYCEFLASPLDEYRMKMAVNNADSMAERVWDFYKDKNPTQIGNATSARAYRKFLVAKECPDSN